MLGLPLEHLFSVLANEGQQISSETHCRSSARNRIHNNFLVYGPLQWTKMAFWGSKLPLLKTPYSQHKTQK